MKQPIEKFSWETDSKRSTALLEYVSLLDPIYTPNIDMDVLYTMMVAPSDNTSSSKHTPEEIEEAGCRPFNLSTSAATLADRYNNGLLTNTFKYEDYIKETRTQELIKELELDADKFWFLLSFCLDYSIGTCIEGIGEEDPPIAQVQFLIQELWKAFNDADNLVLNKPTQLKLEVKGKHSPFAIKDPLTLRYLSDILARSLKDKELMEDSLFSNGLLTEATTSTSTSESVHIWYFAKMLFNFFDMQSQVVAKRRKGASSSTKEKELISRLIYYTRISKNENLLDIENDTLKGYLSQYKNNSIDGVVNRIYPYNL